MIKVSIMNSDCDLINYSPQFYLYVIDFLRAKIEQSEFQGFPNNYRSSKISKC